MLSIVTDSGLGTTDLGDVLTADYTATSTQVDALRKLYTSLANRIHDGGGSTYLRGKMKEMKNKVDSWLRVYDERQKVSKATSIKSGVNKTTSAVDKITRKLRF